MALIVKSTGGGDYKLVEPGSHVARCVRIIDLGTQSGEYQGKPIINQKIQLCFEIPEQTIEIEGKVLPMMLSKEYTQSLHEKANLRHDLESWRGRAFTEEELKGFDLSNVLGVTAILSVVHGKSEKSGKTFAKISGISKIMKGIECPPAVNDQFIYEIDMREEGTWAKIPEWTQKRIKESLEMTPVTIQHSPDYHSNGHTNYAESLLDDSDGGDPLPF